MGNGNGRKFAFVTGGERESAPRYVAIPDSPGTKAFFVKIATMQKSDSVGDAMSRATRAIHTFAEVEAALSKVQELALTTNDLIRRELTENIHDTLNALGLVVYEQLSNIYEEDEV